MITLFPCNCSSPTSLSVNQLYNATSPLPVPLNGEQPNLSNACDCRNGINYTSSAGNNWASYGYWQGNVCSGSNLGYGNPVDLLTVQSFNTSSQQLILTNAAVGFKNVTAKKQWHGTFGWTSLDNCNPTASVVPDQIKYAVYSSSCSLQENNALSCTQHEKISAIGGGRVTVNTNTGLITQDLNVIQDNYVNNTTSSTVFNHSRHVNAQAGYQNDGNGGANTYYSSSMTSFLDVAVTYYPICTTYPTLPDYYRGQTDPTMDSAINDWNALATYVQQHPELYPNTTVSFLPTLTSSNQYLGSASYVQNNPDNDTYYRNDVSFYWIRQMTSAVVTVSNTAYNTDTGSCPGYKNYNYTATYNLSGSYSASQVTGECESLLGNWDLGSQYYPWRSDSGYSYSPLVQLREVGANIKPSIVYQAIMNDYTQPLTDGNGNAAFTLGTNPSPDWPFTYNPNNNDCSGRPHTDPNYSGPCDWIPSYAQIAWEDPNSFWYKWKKNPNGCYVAAGLWADSMQSTHMDGTIVGKPFGRTVSGSYYIGTEWFDYYYDDEHFCKVTAPVCSGPPYIQFKYESGATLADAIISNEAEPNGAQLINILPPNATKWLNNIQAHGIGQGGSIGSGMLFDGSIHATKWAVTRTPAPSYNYYRPCGEDRFAIDESVGRVFVDTNGHAANNFTVISSDFCLVYANNNQPFPDGVYTNCSFDASNTFSGSFVASLPPDYERWFDYNDGEFTFGLLGKLKFPNAWAFCGGQHCTITNVTGSQYNLELNTNNYSLFNGYDLIELYKNNTTGSLGPYTVYSGSNGNNFKFDCDTSDVVNYTIVRSYNSPPDNWNDNSSKYTWRSTPFYTDYRNDNFNYSGSCVNGTVPAGGPCGSASVMVVSPNVESFGSTVQKVWFGSVQNCSVTQSAASIFKADDVYKSVLQQNIDFLMIDPVYQQEFFPPNLNPDVPNPIYKQSLGACENDSVDPDTGAPIIFYPPPLFVEATCSPVHPLQFGLQFPVEGQPTIPNTVLGYNFFTQISEWNIYDNELISNGSGSSCRFNGWYQWPAGPS